MSDAFKTKLSGIMERQEKMQVQPKLDGWL